MKNHRALVQTGAYSRSGPHRPILLSRAGRRRHQRSNHGTLPLARPIRVNAGPALVTATASGFKQFEMSVPVEAGKETQLKIVLEANPLAPAPISAPSSATAISPLITADVSPQSSWRTWTGATLIGVGSVVAAWGIVWIAIDGRQASGSCTAPNCVPLYNTKTVEYVLTGVGVAAAASRRPSLHGQDSLWRGQRRRRSLVALPDGPVLESLRARSAFRNRVSKLSSGMFMRNPHRRATGGVLRVASSFPTRLFSAPSKKKVSEGGRSCLRSACASGNG